MRNDMLFIDGQLVDLDESTKITLNFKSNIFSDLSKISSYNSYTIKLPNTVRNQMIIKYADIPSSGSDFMRTFHNARYIRNGIEIISDALAVLISTGETIDLALTWGNSSVFESIVKSEKKLSDLSSRAASSFDKYPFDTSGNAKPKIDYGFNENDSTVSYHPVISSSWIIKQIQLDNGIELLFPDWIESKLEKIVVPLLMRKDDERYADDCKIVFKMGTVTYSNQINNYLIKPLQSIGDQSYYGYARSSNNMLVYHSSISNGVPKIFGRIEFVFHTRDSIPNVPTFIVYSWNNNTLGTNISINEVLTVDAKSVLPVDQRPGYYQAIFEFTGDQTSVLSEVKYNNIFGCDIRFAIGNIGNGSTIEFSTISGEVSVVNMAEKVILKDESNNTDGRYPIVTNLPDIKQIDFIKMVASLFGLFAIPDSNRIKFVSVDEIFLNKSNALDWTKRVVASFYENKPMEMKYTLEGFAQRNLLKWKEDRTLVNSYDSALLINNQTLDYERDAIVLPFAATDDKRGIAFIPIYSYERDGSLSYSPSDVEPRLLILSSDKRTAYFEGLEWNTVLSNYYSEYSKIINNIVIIREKVEINDFELKNLDLTVPIYLGQYGRYYAIISVKAEDTGICECELLQLEV